MSGGPGGLPPDPYERLQASAEQGARATVWAVTVSALLGVVKVVAGWLGNSYALIADGIESMLDIASALVVWGSLKISSRRPSARFPYGFGKVESLAALVVASVLLLAAAGIAVESVREIKTPHHAPAPFTLVVLVLVVAVKEGLFRRLRRTGERIGSRSVETDAWHHRSDALTSVAAFIGISVALVGGEGWEQADDFAALFASAVIAFNGLRLLRSAWYEVLDVAPSAQTVEAIRARAAAVPGVAALDKCRVRKSGLGLFVDLHVVVDGQISVEAGHAIAHQVKDTLLAAELDILDVALHVEPFDPAAAQEAAGEGEGSTSP